jgi:hypothetical protein
MKGCERKPLRSNLSYYAIFCPETQKKTVKTLSQGSYTLPGFKLVG